jgi:hypothetical protein
MNIKRDIIQTKGFSKKIDQFLSERKVLQEDFESLKKNLTENPERGDLISGTGGVRKIRLKSSSKGTRGGFRVCYFDDPGREELFLMHIYPKNEQEDISPEEKKALKKFAEMVKRR